MPKPTEAMVMLVDFIAKLDAHSIAYRLDSIRAGSVCVHCVVPGERWEVEFMTDGTVEVEIFRSDGQMLNEDFLTQLFALGA